MGDSEWTEGRQKWRTGRLKVGKGNGSGKQLVGSKMRSSVKAKQEEDGNAREGEEGEVYKVKVMLARKMA